MQATYWIGLSWLAHRFTCCVRLGGAWTSLLGAPLPPFHSYTGGVAHHRLWREIKLAEVLVFVFLSLLFLFFFFIYAHTKVIKLHGLYDCVILIKQRKIVVMVPCLKVKGEMNQGEKFQWQFFSLLDL